jgi:predicted ester cyclase
LLVYFRQLSFRSWRRPNAKGYAMERKTDDAPPTLISGRLLVAVTACTPEKAFMDPTRLNDFGSRYTAAWCSQNAASVASFFTDRGSLKVNDASPAVGRAAITAVAQGFMTAFPDLVITMDKLSGNAAKVRYHWTLTGTNTGPSGTGQFVRISGFEQWRFGPDRLITESKGHFDAADYQRQLTAGARGS